MCIYSRGAAPPGPSARADGRAGGGPSLSTLFFLFTFWGATFSTLLFFSVFEGLQAPGGMSSFWTCTSDTHIGYACRTSTTPVYKSWDFPRAPPAPPLARTGGRAAGLAVPPFSIAFFDLWLICLIFVWGSTEPGRYLIFAGVKFHVECIGNLSWRSPGARFPLREN